VEKDEQCHDRVHRSTEERVSIVQDCESIIGIDERTTDGTRLCRTGGRRKERNESRATLHKSLSTYEPHSINRSEGLLGYLTLKRKEAVS
jgi:uncharacterized protein YlaI